MLQNKPASDKVMIAIVFGKGEGAAGVTTDPLAQGVVPALLMIGHAAAFSNRMMLLRWHNKGIDVELVGIDRTDRFDRLLARPATVFEPWFRSGRQWRKPQFDAYGDIGLSTASV